MTTESVRIDWVHGRISLVKDRVGFPIVMTQPFSVNAANLLLLSVIGYSI
jgi:hypothetical protein